MKTISCIFCAMLCASCSLPVHPSAEVVSKRLDAREYKFDEFKRFLERRHFKAISPKSYGGFFVKDAECFEKTRGSALGGVEIVRVCIGKTIETAAIFSRNTHGHEWTEVFPNDQSDEEYGGKLYRLSDQTIERLIN